MPTNLQQAASRANGAKSQGPVSPQGKLHSSLNSRTHGLCAASILLDGEESHGFEALQSSFLAELAPRNECELRIVNFAITASWRLGRLVELETNATNAQIRLQPGGLAPLRAAAAFTQMADSSRVLDLLNRYESRNERQFYRALNQLARLRNGPHPLLVSHPPPENAAEELPPVTQPVAEPVAEPVIQPLTVPVVTTPPPPSPTSNLPNEPQISLKTLDPPSQVPLPFAPQATPGPPAPPTPVTPLVI